MFTLKELKHLSVETTSGMYLGKVVDAELDEESHMVVTYIVQPGRLTQPLVRKSLRIHRSQVVSITKERMVVDDAVTPIAVSQRSRENLTKDAPSPISARSV